MTPATLTERRTMHTADTVAIRPFRFEAAEAELDELRRRINATRWPDPETVTNGSQGVQLAFMKALKTRLEAWQAELVANDPTTGSEPSAVAALDRSLDPETFHGAIAIRMGIHTLAAKIAWCDEAILRIERRLEGEK